MKVIEANPLISADLELALPVSSTAGARLVFTIRQCAADTDAVILADSLVGLLESPEETPTATAATVARTSGELVDVWIKAAVMNLLELRDHICELREITDDGKTRSLLEGLLMFRRNAGREVAD